jgi:hypothetical protein
MTDATQPIYCANHPQVETSLHCNRCGKPICPKCAVSTPTGYRCKDCVRGQQKVFETSLWYDYMIAAVLSGIISLVGSRIVPPFGFFTLLLSPVAGVIIAEAVRFAVRKRRSRRLFQTAAIAAAAGSVPLLIISIISGITFASQGGFGFLWELLWQAVYAFVVTSTVYYRLSGIQMRT